jgi:hypothetical protein
MRCSKNSIASGEAPASAAARNEGPIANNPAAAAASALMICAGRLWGGLTTRKIPGPLEQELTATNDRLAEPTKNSINCTRDRRPLKCVRGRLRRIVTQQ